MQKPIRILVTEPEYFTPESLAQMKKIGTVVTKRMAHKELLKAVKDVDALVVRVETKVDKELLQQAKQLRLVVTATMGLNHIDIDALNTRGIKLYSLQGQYSISTAEHAIALMFSVARNIPPAYQHILSGKWDRWEFMGTELHTKTLGIFGLGRIGREVASRAQGLGMKVVAYDPYITKAEMEKVGVKKCGWPVFLKSSDVITLHSFLAQKTKGMFGKKEFMMMKPSAFIINTARGDLIQGEALVEALQKGRIRGAAFDVYPEEPPPASSPLLRYAKKHSNLILTPHLGASTHEAMASASMFAANAVRDFFQKKK